MRRQLLGGRYRLVEPLGEGGMGQVWEARDEKLDRVVAVKVISLLSGSGSHAVDARARFLREARLTARLQHRNTVTLHDVGEAEVEGRTTPFLVMERLRGEGLDALLRNGRIEAADAARWGAQVADALAEAHEVGVMHRDIKPSNIMITRSGDAKVLDFGIARAADPSATAARLTQTGFIVGTPQYMAPEQARGRPEPSSDLYALGCVLFELLTGRLPFEAPDSIGHLTAHLTDDPPPPGSVAPGVPAEWDALVMRLLEKEPGSRHRDAVELAADLRRLAVAAPVTSPAVPTEPLRPARPTVPVTAHGQGAADPDGRRAAYAHAPAASRATADADPDARRMATIAIAGALTCLPLAIYFLCQATTFLTVSAEERSVPGGLLVAHLLVGLAETIALGAGVALLRLRRSAGRRTTAVAGGATALHGLGVGLQYEAADASYILTTLAHIIGPLMAAAAATAAVAALRPSTGGWCSEAPTASAPVARSGVVASALVTLLVAAVVPTWASEAAHTGRLPFEAATLQTMLFALLSALLAVGLALVLVPNPAGRVVVALGGLGLALLALYQVLHTGLFTSATGTLLAVMMVAAGFTAARAVTWPGHPLT